MTTSPRNNLSITNSQLHANYFCPFCGENSYNEGTIKSCTHLKYIWRERDGNSENALIYVTDDVRKYLAEEGVDHFQIWEVLCLEPPFEDTFVIEQNFDLEDIYPDQEYLYTDDLWDKDKHGFRKSQVLSVAWQYK